MLNESVLEGVQKLSVGDQVVFNGRTKDGRSLIHYDDLGTVGIVVVSYEENEYCWVRYEDYYEELFHKDELKLVSPKEI